MKRVLPLVLPATLLCVALSVTSASAVIINELDKFGDFQYQSASGPNGDNNSTDAGRTVVVSAGNGLLNPSGRSVFIEKTSGSTNVNLKVEGLDDDSVGTFSVSRASGIGGRVLVQWDGGTLDNDAPLAFSPLSNLTFGLGGGAGLNLTAGGATGLAIRVLDADLANQQLTLTLFGANNTVASVQSVLLPSVAAPFDAIFPFAGFTLLGGAASTPNPNAIRAITLAITGPSGADITLDLLGTYAVPEPATATLFGMGLVGMVAAARRYRRSRG